MPTERTPQPLEPEVSRTLRVAAAAVGLPMWLLVPDEMVKGDGAEAWEPGSTTAHPQAQCLTAAGAAGVRVGRKDCQRHSHWSFLRRPSSAVCHKAAPTTPGIRQSRVVRIVR